MRVPASVAVALLIGLLIGLDRERAEVRKARELLAGVRTFPLIALAGALAMLLRDAAGPGLLVVGFVAVAVLAAISYARASASGDMGTTTEIAVLVTFLLGALAGAGELGLAAAAGVAVAVLLVAKPPLERFSLALTNEELSAVLELAVVSVIVLPLLPDRGYGPWDALNPRQIWLVVVLVSALSFAGFVAVRLLGAGRGTIVTGAIGGLVSSTAVTLAMAERSRLGAEPGATTAATVLASTIMCGRVALLAGVVDRDVLVSLLPIVGAMALVGTGAAFGLLRGARRESTDAGAMKNPFSLSAAITFAAIYAGVLLLARAGQETLGDRGLYATAVLSAVADADAPTIALARLGGTTSSSVLAAAIGLAAVTNTLVKLGLAVGLGAGPFRVRVAGALGAMALTGGAAISALVATS